MYSSKGSKKVCKKMFSIIHDRYLVYSLIKVTKLTRPIFKGRQPIEDLMFLWANKTALPYIKWLWNFKDKGHSLVKD